jgi:acetyl esterase/lipase
LVLCAVALCLAPVTGQEAKHKIKVEKDLVYGKGGEEDLKLDLARPDGDGPYPCIVCIHGGGWRAGQRQDVAKQIEQLAERGFVAVTISYRLSPKHKFPAQIEDCKAAVRWLRANAKKYNLSPDHIGAVGYSAGGHLACLLGAANGKDGLEGNGGNKDQSSQVQAVVSFFGPTDFINKTWSKQVEDTFLVPLLGCKFEDDPGPYKRCSPIAYVTKDAPPYLFFHGDKDTLVNIEDSRKLLKKLQDVGVYAKLVTMEGDGHGWGGEKLTRTLEQTMKFFEEKLKK